MLKSILAAIAVLAILLPSCTKNNALQSAINTDTAYQSSIFQKSEGGDDDDPPVIIGGVYTTSSLPIANACIRFIKDEDTVNGYTNEYGMYSLQLTNRGLWALHISAAMFNSLDTTVNITMPNTERVDILY